ncbi:MAG: NADH-quinone oxidoreductase subunit L [Planctomycetota bacterium]
MELPPDWQLAVRALALAVPAVFLLASLFVTRARAFRRANLVTGAAVGLAALVATGSAFSASASDVTLGVRLDLATSVMLMLVTTIGLIIARYSRNYLRGEPGAGRYVCWLLATLGSVSLLVIADNLLVIAIAWFATSITLHQLLTFYDRTAALVAAHKKFLVSRLADVCLWSGIGLVYFTVGSLDLDAIGVWVAAQDALPPLLQAAAVLFVVAACLKSAQLPFHGWLTQVMEAPTPVSALLHAGVVNIGGFLMIRLAPLMMHASIAQTLLIAIGLTTTVLAALVMTTRVSIKVALAWSTCAQMGFMLVQCGLGAWHLALLHIVAHSLYKAHAFLRSGSTVEAWRVQDITGPSGPAAPARLAMVGAVAVGAVALVTLAGTFDVSTVALSLIVGLSLVPMLRRGLEAGVRPVARAALQSAGIVALYFGWHALASHLMPEIATATAPLVGWILVALGFVGLFAIQSVLRADPNGALARRLHPWLFNGFHLDERFTRLTFRIWPPRLQPRTARAPIGVGEPLEAQA